MVALATGMGTRMVRACCNMLPPEAREKGTLPPSKVGVLETKAKMRIKMINYEAFINFHGLLYTF